MKMKMILGALIAATLLFVGCSEKAAEPAKAQVVKPTVSEESLGLRKTDLYSEKTTLPDETKYATAAPMSGKFIDRAFDNAPPMIPHDVEGMLPITTNDNQCVSCHAPELASSMMATPMPKSHFTSFRPVTTIADDGSVVKEGKKFSGENSTLTVAHSLDTMNKARFNCSQCHAPQSTGDLLVENNFRPDFQDESMKRASSMLDTLNAGVE
ncbi:MAG: nitrate reductase cytochrome c-type subunit [Campylobacterota bacterium]|nr:nitrate reductase cytochrome c-type subunit [Campylobacterota bacterium]